MQKLFLLALFFILAACQHDDGSYTPGVFSRFSQEEKTEQANQSLPKLGQVTLQPHQVRTIDYLYKSSQKGLLVNHYLGTGKTILSLAFAAKYPERKVYIILPRFLKGHWQNQLKLLNLDSERFTFTGLNELHKLEQTDFSNSIVIIDESHKLVELLDASDLRERLISSKIYLNVQKAHKILALTGTPIYSSPSNIAHQLNLVAGKELLKTNREKFKRQYMMPDSSRSFFRGHLLESLIFENGSIIAAAQLPLTLGLFADPGKNLAAGFVLSALTRVGYSQLRNNYSLERYGLKIFSVEKLKPVTRKYVSFYGFSQQNDNASDYPSKTIHIRDVYYNPQQYNFYLSCLDKDLSLNQTWYLLRDDNFVKNFDEEKRYFSLNINSIQENLLEKNGFGREIGNIIFKDKNKIVVPPKFKQLYEETRRVNGPIMIYSHYYKNGLLLLAKYLKSTGVPDSDIAILHPDAKVEDQNKVVADFNKGLTKYLLIHPEISEGISLKGTAQVHFLETPLNKSFQEQIIGRAIRYHSHHHLPEADRHVDVFVWKHVLESWNFNNMIALRYNWFEKNRELSYYASGGAIGRAQVDKNAQRKNITPDQRSFIQLESLSHTMISLKALLAENSIETHKA